ncbi:cytochrome-c peroxidase [Acidocella sp.]|uniref:cytochrome-c peroxidase n=1 Tax=Acidocella sp. TaxID=50710 RepID=UPI0026318E9D|nr:cytochrome c peroxidase [Acidocella sp.]
MRGLAGLALLVGLGICITVGAAYSSPVPLGDWLSHPRASLALAQGENPAPVVLVRPRVAPLSAMAQLGKAIFFDPSLSGSGRLSCASCHDPQNFYGPPGALPAMMGGAHLTSQGARAVPSLMYLDHQPNFSIGLDTTAGEDDFMPVIPPPANAPRVTKTALDNAQSAANLVPQGGLFWDGRADTLQTQALGPLLNPVEMDGGTIAAIAAKLKSAPYAADFTTLFGQGVFNDPQALVSEAVFAVARYEMEAPSFHPYSSKFDAWLEGKARFTPAELRGYLLFNNPAKGDCGACHADALLPGNRPPLFTDHQYEALGVPRNPAIALNRNPAYFDLGLCGPYRTDMAAQTRFCGMFLTPTLRNVATRKVFFHNGAYHTLQQVLDFYDFRDTEPAKIYPIGPEGRVEKFNDLPQRYRANVDRIDPPLNRHKGEAPAMSRQDEADIIAFLNTLTDGYVPRS